MEKTITDAAQLFSRSHTIVLSTHIMPDGDGLGAEIALYYYLKRIGKDVRILNPDPMPERYQFLNRAGIFEVFDPKKNKISDIDLAVIVDTNDPKRVGSLWTMYEKNAKDILFFDHHPHEVEENPALPKALNIHTVVDVKSSSIGELLYRLFNQSHDLLDLNSSSFKLSPEIALGLYVSIITDTNSFRYSRTTALSHRIAAELIDYGLQPEEIYQNVYATKSIDHLRLIGEVLKGVDEISVPTSLALKDKTIAWVEIPLSVRKKYSASPDDTQNIVNFLLLLKNAEVLVLLREEDDHRIKVSLKSRGLVIVNEVAAAFGGGGHEFASGFVVQGKLSEIREQLLEKLKKL